MEKLALILIVSGPKVTSIEALSKLNRFVEPPLTGPFCDLLWADPLLEEVLGYKLSDRDYADVSEWDPPYLTRLSGVHPTSHS